MGATVTVGTHLILYDGLCGLCSRLNQFVLAQDSAEDFCFASLQSAHGRGILDQFGRDPNVLDTFYVVVDCWSETPNLLAKSRAALFVARALGRPWSWLTTLDVLPDRLLDLVYDLVAKNRYRFFGRHDTCPLPSAQQARRFVDT